MTSDLETKALNVLDLIAPSFFRAYKDVSVGMDTDPTSPTYGQKLREYFFSGGRGCVDGDTLIDTPTGRMRIRDFKGGSVYSYDGEGRIVVRKADAAQKYRKERLYRVTCANGNSILVTDEHRFMTANRGWVMTKDLIPLKDEMVCASDFLEASPSTVIEVVYEKTDNYYDVYVDETHSYLAAGFVNHNSTKSSFISLMIVLHLLRNPKANAIVFVRVAEGIRDSVYKQILWAIDHLELNAFFKCTTSPFRCTFLPTGQEILFRGLDKAGKIKGIKPSVGYFDTIWFEELTEFSGMEDVRSVIQSALRGGDDDEDIGENVQTWEFYSYNPPPTLANWVNVEANVVTPGRKCYHSNYLTVNPRWLGRNFFERAEILKRTNNRAYRHEYLGEITGTGRNIFTNLVIRNIEDAEIESRFDNRCFGIDWGFAGDPFVWLGMNFDKNNLDLYIFDEIVDYGLRTQISAEKVKKKMAQVGGLATVLADSAEPDSIADYNAWGVRVEGAPKPHGKTWSGRDYEIKALQSLHSIVIDPRYAPETARKMQQYEYPVNAHGDIMHQYPHFDELDACLVPETIVSTRDGDFQIGDLVGREGELLSYDMDKRTFGYERFCNCRMTRRSEWVMRLELKDGRVVECTPDHKILTSTRGWIQARQLTPLDRVMTIAGSVQVKEALGLGKRREVYDLEVPRTHNFVVNGGVVVHNCRYGAFYNLRDTHLYEF